MSKTVTKKGFNTYMSIALAAGSSPSKEDLYKVLFYVRQILGVLAGIVAGTLGLTGLIVILGFLALNCFITHVYAYNYLKVDQDKVEQKELYIESLVISALNFNITWIATYTFVFLRATVPYPLAQPDSPIISDL